VPFCAKRLEQPERAERRSVVRLPERFVQQALGHNSKEKKLAAAENVIVPLPAAAVA